MYTNRSVLEQYTVPLWGHKVHGHARVGPYVAKQAHMEIIMIEGVEAAHRAWLPKNPRSQRVIPLL
jgi:hypothetical protein